MSFVIVQTRRSVSSNPELSVIPSSWVTGDIGSWPPRGAVKLARDPTSKPEKDWLKYNVIVLATLETLEEAEARLEELKLESDSEDAMLRARSTRSQPGAKQKKFLSQKFTLHKPPKPVNSFNSLFDIRFSGPIVLVFFRRIGHKIGFKILIWKEMHQTFESYRMKFSIQIKFRFVN